MKKTKECSENRVPLYSPGEKVEMGQNFSERLLDLMHLLLANMCVLGPLWELLTPHCTWPHTQSLTLNFCFHYDQQEYASDKDQRNAMILPMYLACHILKMQLQRLNYTQEQNNTHRMTIVRIPGWPMDVELRAQTLYMDSKDSTSVATSHLCGSGLAPAAQW